MTPRLHLLPLLVFVMLAEITGCKPRLDSADPSERLHAVGNVTDQTILGNVAIGDASSDVRQAALDKLTDQTVLARVAVDGSASDVRRAAVRKLTVQTVLAKIAIGDLEDDVRRAAIGQLTDQALLAKVAIEDRNSDVRRAAAGQLTDQALLAKVAIESRDSKVSRPAVEKLTDQTLLAKVAIESANWDIRYATVEKLADQATLARFAMGQMTIDTNLLAFNKLTDQALLAKLAIEHRDPDARRAAVSKLTDQAVLGKVAMESLGFSGFAARCDAVRKLTDQGLLAKLAAEDGERGIRPVACLRLHELITHDNGTATVADPATRLYFSVFSKIHSARLAVSKENDTGLDEVPGLFYILTDPFVMAELGSVNDFNVKWEPVSQAYVGGPDIKGEKISVSVTLSKVDHVLLFSWAAGFPKKANMSLVWSHAEVSAPEFSRAICALLSAPALANIAIENGRPDLQQSAIEKLSDPAVLAKVASESKDSNIRNTANARLEKLSRNESR